MAKPEQKFVVSAENRASQVLKKVENDFDGLGVAATRAGEAFNGFAATATAALTGAFSVAAMKATVDRMDDLSKSAQRANMSAEGFSRLAFAGALADISMQDLQDSLGKLAKAQGDAARGSAEQAKAFETLDISYKNADGSLRDTSEVFLDFADKFQEFQGTPEIIALGMQLFGRSFQNLIPLLKDGAGGLRAAGKEADLFGVTLDTAAGQRAEAFNDNLTRLGTQVRGFAQIVVSEALEPAGQFTDELVRIGTEAINAKGGIRDLAGDGTLRVWAQNAAIMLATIGESLVFLGKAAHTVAGSFSAVWADIQVASAVSRNMFGGFLFEPSRKALEDSLANRETVVRDANARLLDLINYDGASLSNALREQFAKTPEWQPASFSDARFEAQRRELDRRRRLLFGSAGGGKSKADPLAPIIDAAIQRDRDRIEAAKGVLEEFDGFLAQLLADDEAKLRAQADAWRDAIDPMRKYREQLEAIDRLEREKGGLTSDEATRARLKVGDDIDRMLAGSTKSISDLDEFSLQAARSIQAHLGDETYNLLSGKFDGIGQRWLELLNRMAADALSVNLSRSLFGDFARSGNVGGLLGQGLSWLMGAGVSGGIGVGLGSSIVPGMTSADDWMLAGLTARRFASGIDFVPYDDYPALLHRGERVTPAIEASKGADGVTIHSTVNAAPGVTAAQFNALLDQRDARLKAELLGGLKRGRYLV